jgi:hypothetical protein
MTKEDLTDDMVYTALYQELSPEEALMKNLARKQPSTLRGLMDKVEEFINQKETLKAMANLRSSQEGSPERKKKRGQEGKVSWLVSHWEQEEKSPG